MYVGQSVKRVDAIDKVTGCAKYTDDLCNKSTYVARGLGDPPELYKAFSEAGLIEDSE
ncbi:MAG: hypothetical protein K6A71_11635 [Lachnospiraceae bacterium]|nr:hypothetical protein [Lachnospiraceae bacterium]